MQGPPGEHLLVSLLVLLAQQRQYIATQSLVGQLKLMLELFDQCTETLSQVSIISIAQGLDAFHPSATCCSAYPVRSAVQHPALKSSPA